ncbi:hypothetical protein IU501_02200 [Nocardia otitidiscaviarum]|uniref:membrane protein n=1 Tax=Nocardia otitidiscaviarum TaxID=1823 RepID=UPI0004A6F6A5|nr:membrane protein [Nocardia otitidiscaviarum]MBF6131817.1 hypothetical protein [Nocardia otitidiscaviarum]MBF6482948.1 hypothetical protein [Nocardia otitidiscaviarum]
MASPQLRHLAGHLLTPLLMCLGMGLAYLGAFHQPEPHHLQVAVIGDSPEVKVLAQTLKDGGGTALEVVTLPDREQAVARLRDRELSGAYLPGPGQPELLVAKAGSDTTAMAVEAVFGQVAARQGAPLTVTDVAAPAAGDPTAQGLFFLLVALSIGSYTSVAVIGAAGAALSMGVRALLGLGMSLAVSVIGIVLAGPVFHIVDHGYAGVWGLGLLYSAGVVAVGIGLHTFLQRWTTLALMVLFVMLNFTTAGGVYGPELQNGFFGALHAFWNGAGFVEGARGLLYFDNAGLGGRLLSLLLWLAAGLALVVVAARYERARSERSGQPTESEIEAEIEEAVGV